MENTDSEQLRIYSQQPNNTVTNLCKDVKLKADNTQTKNERLETLKFLEKF